MENPYRVLGVGVTDSKKRIREKYHQLSKKYHPDNPVTGDAEKFLKINKAWKYFNENLSEDSVSGDYWHHNTLFDIVERN